MMRSICLVALAVMIAVAGCAFPAKEATPDIQSGSVNLELVESESSSPAEIEEEAFAPESPAAHEAPPLPKEEEPAEKPQTSVASSSSSSSLPQNQAVEDETEEEVPASLQKEPAVSSLVASASEEPQATTVSRTTKTKEVRSVWISYLDLASMLNNRTQAQFTQSISKAFDNIQQAGLNSVIVQVRPFGDALYDSDYFPWSYTITGTEGKNPGFDPLDIVVEQAGKRGLRVEAWINPYRVRASGNNNALSSDNPAQKWLDEGKQHVVRYNGATSYNPASEEAQTLIINGVAEIAANYAVDAIHIDDYFYPTTDAAFDAPSYTRYQNGGGKLSLADWRRSNVEKLLRGMYSAIKKANPNVEFGISPQGNLSNNYDQQYLDVAKIVSTSGYCDYICPQLYYGFENQSHPFSQTLKEWNSLIKSSSVDLYVGVAAYKVGTVDTWAGSGKDEWTQNTKLLTKMVEESRDMSRYGGFVLYRYDSLFQPAAGVRTQINKEREALVSLLN